MTVVVWRTFSSFYFPLNIQLQWRIQGEGLRVRTPCQTFTVIHSKTIFRIHQNALFRAWKLNFFLGEASKTPPIGEEGPPRKRLRFQEAFSNNYCRLLPITILLCTSNFRENPGGHAPPPPPPPLSKIPGSVPELNIYSGFAIILLKRHTHLSFI